MVPVLVQQGGNQQPGSAPPGSLAAARGPLGIALTAPPPHASRRLTAHVPCAGGRAVRVLCLCCLIIGNRQRRSRRSAAHRKRAPKIYELPEKSDVALNKRASLAASSQARLAARFAANGKAPLHTSANAACGLSTWYFPGSIRICRILYDCKKSATTLTCI